MNTSIPSLTYCITTPIFYCNGLPHLGHAYTLIAADVLARWKRKMGYDVFFLTGTDEHGQKVEQAAEKANLTPQLFVDQISSKFNQMAAALNISNNYFIRTTNEEHKSFCQEIWRDLEQKGFIYLSVYKGWYSTRDECYYSADEVYTQKNGTQIAIETGNEVTWIEEPSYFFRLSEFKDKIFQHIGENKEFISPTSSRNEILALIENAEDVCISRTSFAWGIKVPQHDNHVMYVWIDALMNYITSLAINDKMEFWPADLHLIGKEIARFHVIIWPAILLALDYPLPKRIFAHGWWTAEGKKMSKSVGNVVDPFIAIEKYGVDRLRYYMLREMPFGNDGDFSHHNLIKKTNADLSNDLGNLAQRVLSIVSKRGVIPRLWMENSDDGAMLTSIKHLENKVNTALEHQNFTEALDSVWDVVRSANVYITVKKPWSEPDQERTETVLAVLLIVLREVANILTVFMPNSMNKMISQLDSPLATPVPIFPRHGII